MFSGNEGLGIIASLNPAIFPVMRLEMVKEYDEAYKNQVIDLILYVQNIEYDVGISILEQPDILDISRNYIDGGGNFWIALNDEGKVIGSIGLQKKNKSTGILKKFFVYREHRGTEIAMSLYDSLLAFAENNGLSTIILDTPSVAERSHAFYKKVGFQRTTKEELPIDYDYPDRNSILFRLDLS